VPTPTEIFGGYNSFEGQFTGTDTKETEKLFSEALAEPDKAKRQQLYTQLQEFVNNEQYISNVVYEPFAWAFQNKVQGLYVGNTGIPWLEDASISE
jgi:ABC-type transport system substrate-binding protein